MQHPPFMPPRNILLLLLCLICATLLLPPIIHAADAPTIIYVKANVTGANNGTSWHDAYTDLQDALANAQAGTQIWVAQGVYYPFNIAKRYFSFQLQNGVALYGGFTGTEQTLDERDWLTNPTILSGDLDRNDTHTNGVVIDTSGLVGSNSYHVVIGDAVDESAILDGFVITAGWANGEEQNGNGGGLYISNSSPTIRNITFSGNSATNGGAIYDFGPLITYPDLTLNISNVSFYGNSATNGGAIYNNGGLSIISNASFSTNTATYGGAIFNNGGLLIINNASFSTNTATYGGAIFNNRTSIITNVTFSGNSATDGGAIYNNQSSLHITNATFSGNSATNGGAIYDYNTVSPTHGPNLHITNATISGNSATNGGAIFSNYGSFALMNSILWGNSSSIVQNISPGQFRSIIFHSLVQGCDPSGVWGIDCGVNHSGNLPNTDPLFINPIDYTDAPTTTGDLRLQANSPAINQGVNDANDSTVDLQGMPRIIGSRIDLGAYEAGYQLETGVVGGGQVSHTPSNDWYTPNTTITFTATAKPGWSFAGWSGDLSGSSSPTTLKIDSTKHITATFTNDAPTANAGTAQTVRADTLVTLNGSASFDADPTQTLTYLWKQTAGTPVTLTGANTAKPSFIAPNVTGTLTFSLIVTDSLGKASTADSVMVTVLSHRLFLPLMLR